MSLVLDMVLFAAGFVLWTFTEYGLHNWAGHLPKGRHEVSKEHLDHHRDVTYFTPALRKMFLAVPVVGGLSLISLNVSDLVSGSWAAGVVFVIGFGFGWSWYETLHRRIHTHAPLNRYGSWARRHHFHHHFADPKRNHGVTTDLWDRVFGTLAEPRRIRVPLKKVSPWMLDGAGDIAAQFADNYELVRPRRS